LTQESELGFSQRRTLFQTFLIKARKTPGAHSATLTRPDKPRMSPKSASCTPSPPSKSPRLPQPNRV
jgi:hypothetical protein